LTRNASWADWQCCAYRTFPSAGLSYASLTLPDTAGIDRLVFGPIYLNIQDLPFGEGRSACPGFTIYQYFAGVIEKKTMLPTELSGYLRYKRCSSNS
jgi:hypothetical protein